MFFQPPFSGPFGSLGTKVGTWRDGAVQELNFKWSSGTLDKLVSLVGSNL